jgi:hypothetical protein
MIRLRPVLTAIGVALMVVGAVGGVTAVPSSAQERQDNYSVSADASSLLFELEAPDAGLVVGSQLVNATPARAFAAIDSLGTSRALAAAGYPGDVPFELPGTLIGVFSGFEGVRDLVPLLPPVPDYPLAVQSDLANPRSSTESGAFTVSASTAQYQSTADALLGADQGGATATSALSSAASSFDPDTSTATGEALAETSGLRVAGILDISQRTTGTISATPGGTPTMRTDTFFGISLVGSQAKIGFGPEGLTAVGQSLVDQTALRAALSSLSTAGIDIEYLPETTSEDGSTITSAGMRISQTFTVPDEAAFLNELGLPFNANVGRIVSSITFGQVTLRADVSTFEIPSFGADIASSTPVDSGGSGGLGPIATGTPSSPTPTPTTSAGTTPTTKGPASSAPPFTGVTSSQRDPDVFSSSSFYLVLVGAAMAALGSSRLVGNLSIRLRI